MVAHAPLVASPREALASTEVADIVAAVAVILLNGLSRIQ